MKYKTIIIAYIPVLHYGYWQFFTENQAEQIYLFGPELIKKFDYLRKEIRALPPKLVKKAIQSWNLSTEIQFLTLAKLQKLAKEPNLTIIAPKEDVTKKLIETYLPNANVKWSSVFLRWDRQSAVVNKKIIPDKVVKLTGQDKQMMAKAFAIADQSSDWWRHVGAVLVDKNGKFIASAANHHLPSDHTPYALGDVRSLFKRGINVEMGTAIHAEGALIARAAATGVSLKGARLFLTDFPCPYCARIVANSGISKLFFVHGYAMLDGGEILRNSGVKLIKVEVDEATQKKAYASSIRRPYTKNGKN